MFQTETALVYDAVHLFARALTDADMSQVNLVISMEILIVITNSIANYQEITPARLSCSVGAAGAERVEGGTWQHGSSLLNYMKLVSKST